MKILEIRARIRAQHPRKHKNRLKWFKNFQFEKFIKILPKKSGETSARGQGRMGPSLAHPLPPMQRKTRGGLSLPLKNFFIFFETNFAPSSRSHLETLGNLMSPNTEKLDHFERNSPADTKLKISEKFGILTKNGTFQNVLRRRMPEKRKPDSNSLGPVTPCHG